MLADDVVGGAVMPRAVQLMIEPLRNDDMRGRCGTPEGLAFHRKRRERMCRACRALTDPSKLNEYLLAHPEADEPILRVERVPVEPLVEVFGRSDVLHGVEINGRRQGSWGETISIISADRIATRLGLHPSAIWGSEWWDATRRQWESHSRWPIKPLLAMGLSYQTIGDLAGNGKAKPTLSRGAAQRVCDALGLDPGEVWKGCDEWEDWRWVGP